MIEVGEYVRTKKGKIFKYGKGRAYLGKDNEIVKHSKSIIDLIEVGDIVNNGYIYETGNSEDGYKWVHNLNGLLLFEEDIKTILTKEQYQSNCYTVERKEEC